MKTRILHWCWLGLEGVALGAALCVGFALVVFFRVAHAPLSLDALSGHVESLLEARLPEGFDVAIDGLSLQSGRGRDGAEIVVEGLAIDDPSGDPAVRAARAAVRLSMKDLIARKPDPVVVALYGAEVRIIRDESGALSVGAGGSIAMPGRSADEPDTTFRDILIASSLETLVIEDASLSFEDRRSNRTIMAPGVRADVRRDGAGVRADWSGVLKTPSGDAPFSGRTQSIGDGQGTRVTFRIDDAPSSEALAVLFGAPAERVLQAPVSFAVELDVGPDGRINDGAVRASLGAGEAYFVDRPIAVESGALVASFNAPDGSLAIQTLEVMAGENEVRLAGDVGIRARADRALPEAISFDLAVDVLSIDTLGRLVEPLRLTESHFTGGYDVDSGVLDLSRFEAGLLGGRAAGTAGLDFDRDAEEPGSVGATVDLKLDGVFKPDDAIKLWPTIGDTQARDWVKINILDGDIRNVRVKVDLPAGAIGEDKIIPDKAIYLTFDFANGVATPDEGLPAISEIAGSGVLRGNSFRLTAPKARLGGINLRKGDVHITRFRPQGGEGIYRAEGDGDVVEILQVLDSEPLQLMTQAELDPKDFGGRVEGYVEFRQPMRPDATEEDIRYTVKGRVIDGSLQDVWQGAPVTDVNGVIDVDFEGLVLKGSSQLLGAEVDVVFEQAFAEDNATTKITTTGSADPGVGDLFGLATRVFVDGPIRFRSVGEGVDGEILKLHVDADLTDTRFFAPGYLWRKPAGQAASGVLDLDLNGDNIEITNFTLLSDDVHVEATVSLDEFGAVLAGSAPVLKVGDLIDGTLDASRDPRTGRMRAHFVGERVSVGPVIAYLMENPPEEDQTLGSGFHLTTEVDVAELRLGVEFRNAKMDIIHDGKILYYAQIDGVFGGTGEAATASVSVPNEQGIQTISSYSTDAGSYVAGIFEQPFTKGGTIDVFGTMFEDGPGPPDIEGDVLIKDIAVIDAPIVAQIFSAGSLSALDQLLGGGGIAIRTASGRFRLDNGKMTIINAEAYGPAVGISAWGDIDFLNDKVGLYGAVSPLYGVNSVLGRLPGIGGLFVSRKGEGVVAVQYAITGSISYQTVVVNPLSALTPGAMRRIFEPPPQP